MTTAPRLLGTGIALGLAAGLLVGAVLAQPRPAAAMTPSAPPSLATGDGAPSVLGPSAPGAEGARGTSTSNAGMAPAAVSGSAVAAGPAIAYPYFAGTPGLAPDHTIVVSGAGQATLAPSATNRASAQRTALAAALADARTQADAIASATGLTITGVLSVSASVEPYFGVVPIPASGGSSSGGSSSSPAGGTSPGTAVPPVAPAPAPDYPASLDVTVTVAYRVG